MWVASRPLCYPHYDWVDPHIFDIPTCFRGLFALDGFLSKVPTVKPDSPSDAVVANSCNHTDQVYHGKKKTVLKIFLCI